MEKYIELINEILQTESLIQMVFGGQRRKSLPYEKVSLRPVLVQGKLCYQAEYRFQKKVTHENLDRSQCVALCRRLLSEDFKQVNIFCNAQDYQVLASKPDHPKIIKKPPSKMPQIPEHNHKKQYIIADGIPCDFLIRLGVMQKNGQVIPKHYAKFRQINRFLEIVSDVLPQLEALEAKEKRALRIIDFGCGKAYLTFALYYYLVIMLEKNVIITGLDLKEDVIRFCGGIAADLHYDGLNFQIGDIAKYDETVSADMVVTLHACDTATDYALMKAVGWQASVILSVPCCQHELLRQIENEINAPLLSYGILNERFTAILTDGLRALKLEECGYHTDMIEFTSLEHTSKNIMLRAVKKSRVNQKAAGEYEALKQFWHVCPTIDQLKT